MEDNIRKNVGLQTIFQIINTCLPLITAPYLARRLGATQLGIFSYTSSVVAYFTMFAMLGTVNYGTRSIAAVKDDKYARSKTYWGVFSLQIFLSVLSIILYVFYLVFICEENHTIAYLQTISIISCLLDINWFFFGMEKFRITVTRGVIFKVLTVVLILVLVKEENDLWIYTLIMLGGTLLSQAVLFFCLPSYIIWTGISFNEIVKHIKPNLILFVPLLAMSVYHTMDKTMLGIMSDYQQSGFYYSADKVVNIPMSVMNGIGTVMLPRMSALLSKNKHREADHLFIMTLEGIAVASCALACGIAAVAPEFIPVFYGKGYEPCVALTVVFVPILVIKSFSSIARTQYLVPYKMEKEFTKSVIGGAIVNFVLNIILIPQYGAMGAAIATVFAELIACVLQFLSLRRRNLGLLNVFRITLRYLAVGVAMIVFVRMIGRLNMSIYIKLIVEIVMGAFFYIASCMVLWRRTNDEILDIIWKPLFNKIKKQ